MYALQRDHRYHGRPLEGRLVYGDGAEVRVPSSSLNGAFIEDLHDLLYRVTGRGEAERVPSSRECAWCPLTSDDCPDRIESA